MEQWSNPLRETLKFAEKRETWRLAVMPDAPLSVVRSELLDVRNAAPEDAGGGSTTADEIGRSARSRHRPG